MIDRLEDENNELKESAQDMHDKSVTHVNESKNQERELEQLRKAYEKKVGTLKDR